MKFFMGACVHRGKVSRDALVKWPLWITFTRILGRKLTDDQILIGAFCTLTG